MREVRAWLHMRMDFSDSCHTSTRGGNLNPCNVGAVCGASQQSAGSAHLTQNCNIRPPRFTPTSFVERGPFRVPSGSEVHARWQSNRAVESQSPTDFIEDNHQVIACFAVFFV